MATRFKPGNPGGRNGGAPLGAIRSLQKMTAETFREMVEAFLAMTMVELDEVEKDESETAVRRIVARILKQAWDRGDMRNFDSLLNRSVGPVKQSVQVESVNVHATIARILSDSNE